MTTPNTQPRYQVIQQDEYKRMPWKNGLGETLEIYSYEDQGGLRFRISQAAVVEDGEFSNFAGLHRTLVLLSGNGMRLSHKDELSRKAKNTLTSPLDMARFAGGDNTVSRLVNGPIEDLNIMVRASDTKALVVPYFGTEKADFVNNEQSVFSGFYANQTCQVRIGEKDILTLSANCFLLIKQQKTVRLMTGSGVFISVLFTKTLLTKKLSAKMAK